MVVALAGKVVGDQPAAAEITINVKPMSMPVRSQNPSLPVSLTHRSRHVEALSRKHDLVHLHVMLSRGNLTVVLQRGC